MHVVLAVWMKETIEDGGVRGEFILKVPDVELGGGIEVVDMGKGEDRAKVLGEGVMGRPMKYARIAILTCFSLNRFHLPAS